MTTTYQSISKEADDAFNAWIRAGETKLLLSMLPGSTQPPELVATLLRSAFNAGVGAVMYSLVKATLVDKK